MAWWIWLLIVVLVAGLLITGVVIYRVREVRAAGSPLLLRVLPAPDDEGWRHGSVHYSDDALLYYRLRSLRPGPTLSLSRRRIRLGDRRAPRGTELEIMDSGYQIVEVRVGSGESATAVELGMARDVSTAFQSWVEAAGPRRARRPHRAA